MSTLIADVTSSVNLEDTSSIASSYHYQLKRSSGDATTLNNSSFLNIHVTSPLKSLQSSIILRLSAIKNWKINWDGFNSSKPKVQSIKTAQLFLLKLSDTLFEYNVLMQKPIINADEEGNIICEWWEENHKLTVEIDGEIINITKINISKTPIKIENSLLQNDFANILLWFLNKG